MQKRNFGSLKATHRSMLFHRSKAPLSVPSFYLYMLLQSSSVLLACLPLHTKGLRRNYPHLSIFANITPASMLYNPPSLLLML
jgi:hypothetical protein